MRSIKSLNLYTLRDTDKLPTNQFYPVTIFPRPVAGSGGAGNYLTLEGADLELIRRLNPDATTWPDLIWPKVGSVYNSMGDNVLTCASVRWPMVCFSGGNVHTEPIPNLVSVIEERGQWVRIEGIPVGMRYDPLTLNHINTPWLVHVPFCGVKRNRYMPHGRTQVPLFDPQGRTGSAGDKGMWLKRSALGTKINLESF